jgi:hypothetical protein
MSANDTMKTIDEKRESPAIESLRVVDGGHRKIGVTWRAGRRRGRADIVTLSPLIDTLKFYAPIRKNSEIFETVHVIDDGYAIAWGDGSIDMSAASVERLAEEAMTGKDFGDFLRRNCLTHQAAAAGLGRSKRQIENYLQYEALPRVMVLACIGYEARARSECTVTSQRVWAENLLVRTHLANVRARDWMTLEHAPVCVHYETSMRPSNSGYIWTLTPGKMKSDQRRD